MVKSKLAERGHFIVVSPGTASNGELSYFKKNNYGDKSEFRILGDEIKATAFTGSNSLANESYHIKSHLKITNDKSLSDKDDKYIFLGNGLDINEVVNEMKFYIIPPILTILHYKDSLLNGNFKYRKKIGSGVDDYEGLPDDGVINFANKTRKSFNTTTGEIEILNITEYKIENDSVFVNNVDLTNVSKTASSGKSYFQTQLIFPLIIK